MKYIILSYTDASSLIAINKQQYMSEKMDLNSEEIQEVFGIKMDSDTKDLDTEKTPKELQLPLADLKAKIDEMAGEEAREAKELQDAKDRKMFDTRLRDDTKVEQWAEDSFTSSPMKTSKAALRHSRDRADFLNNRPIAKPKPKNTTEEAA